MGLLLFMRLWLLMCLIKVHHLENTGSALAEDVIKKSEIIKTYLMDTKAGTVSICIVLIEGILHSFK